MNYPNESPTRTSIAAGCENAAAHRAIARREANPEAYANRKPMPRVTVTGERINTGAEVDGSDAQDNCPIPNEASLYWRMNRAIEYGKFCKWGQHVISVLTQKEMV